MKPVYHHRYPGIRPFQEGEQQLFFARSREVNDLLTKLAVERLAVLYGKSGMGKTSLLEAGVFPIIRQRHVLVVKLRLGAWNGNELATPIFSILMNIRQLSGTQELPPLLARFPPGNNSLWVALKKIQLENRESQAILLSIDEAEEIFTYPPQMVAELRQQLSDTQNITLPKEVGDALQSDFTLGKESLNDEELELLCKPLAVKVLFAIRSDRLSLLSGFLPGLLEQTYELKPLSMQQAREAITQPARLTGENFNSPTFEFEETTIQAMLEFLGDWQGGYEPFQLQMLCNHAERIAIYKGGGTISPDEMGDFAAILSNFYEDQLNQFSADEQLPVRRLIEEGLIYEEEERRLSLYEGLIFKVYSIAPETLSKLVNSHLLRAEPSLQGGYTYELSHDALIAPILKSKNKRKLYESKMEAEEKERKREYELTEARQIAEKEQQLRNEAEKNAARARWRTRLAIVLSVFALAFGLIAVMKYQEANKARMATEKQIEVVVAQKESFKNFTNMLDSLSSEAAIPKAKSASPTQLENTIKQSKKLLYTIFIQYGQDEDLAKNIRGSLKKNGYTVPSVELVNMDYSPCIKYFHDEDRDKAEELQNYVHDNFKTDLMVIYNRHLNSQAPQGQIEVWLP